MVGDIEHAEDGRAEGTSSVPPAGGARAVDVADAGRQSPAPAPAAPAGPTGPTHPTATRRQAPPALDGLTAVLNLAAVVTVSLALVAELVLVLVNVVLRNVTHDSITSVSEVSQTAIAVMTFVGGALAYHRNMHISLHLVVDKLPAPVREGFRAFAELVVLGTSVVLARFALTVMAGDWGSDTPILGFSVGWIDLPILVGAILFVYYSLLRLFAFSGRTILVAAGAVAAVAAVAAATKSWWQDDFSTHAVSSILLLFLVLLVISVPISITLSILPMVYTWGSGFAGLDTIPRQMGDGINSFLLLAVPFFVFAGFVMAYGGLSERIANISEMIIGKLPGGPLQVIVVSMYVFSGMSGSKNADVVAVGLTMKEMADRAEYEPAETGAVLAASAAMGETIPPSIAMLILGSVASVPVATLLIAGIVPAAVLALLLMILIAIRYWKRPRPVRSHGGAAGAAGTVVKSLPAVALPVILAGGIIGGIGTPTEVSSFAAFYGVLLGVFAYRRLNARTIGRTLRETAELTGFVMYIVSTAAAFAFTLTIMQLPQDVTTFVADHLGENKTLFLIASCVVLVVLGCVLEGVPAILVTVPLLYPVATELGVWNVQYGIVLLIAMGIGTFAPPLGIGTYVVCSVTGATQGDLGRKVWPYLLVLFGGLIMVALFPYITRVLPTLFHMPM